MSREDRSRALDDSMLHEALDGINCPGLVVAINDRSRILWHYARGHADAHATIPVDLDTLFCIGSVTKCFTAQAVLILRDEGKLSLDEPPDFSRRSSFSSKADRLKPKSREASDLFPPARVSALLTILFSSSSTASLNLVFDFTNR